MTTLAHPAQVRTFHPRRGRMTGRHLDALDRLWPRYGVPIPGDPLDPFDPAAVFGRRAPLVLEIGSGMGEATIAMAGADPDRDYLAVEVHTPGVANLLAMVEERGLTNVRVGLGDALELLRQSLAPASLDAIHAFFPDPWPKARHHKRRLFQPPHVALLRSRLAPGGALRCATDLREYAEAMLAALDGDPGLVNQHDGFAPRPSDRSVTKFEQRALAAGRDVFDLTFHRSMRDSPIKA
ncbi:tRNA (guanosine(46)-N7)-methyltransferase TrmB [Actinomycetes bacterium KLBMP 9797]